jgi:hypothetical protein
MDRYWPERVSLFLFGLIVFVLYLFGATTPTRYSDAWWSAFASIVGHLAMVLLLPFWLLLRLCAGTFTRSRQ